MDIGRVGLLDVLGVDGGVGWDFSNTRSQATAVRIKRLEPIHGPVFKSWQSSFISSDVRTLASSFPTFTKAISSHSRLCNWSISVLSHFSPEEGP
jgi:hypothetical protein